MSLRVAFAGTPEFAAVALEALLRAGHGVPLVLTQPDRPSGRGMKLQPSPVKAAAMAHGIPVIQPRSLRLDGRYADDAASARAALHAAGPDIMVVAAYGLILPPWTLTLPRLGCLNIHASLLPRWRGAAPIHRAIEAGDAQTGITIMQMDAGLDTGDMLLVERESIRPTDSTGTLHDRLAELGARAIVDALAQAERGALHPTPQPAQGACYASKVEKSEAALSWQRPAHELAQRIRAFDPFPGAHFTLDGEVVKVWEAQVADGAPGGDGTAAGQVLAAGPQGLEVACGQGVLRLTKLQRPGGRRMTAREFLAARPVAPGTLLTG